MAKMNLSKTYSAKSSDVTRTWYIVDASEVPLGRLATKVATLLTGKHKTMFTPHTDTGDYVIVINADKLVVTGQKMLGKMYYRHSGYPGNLKELTLTEVMQRDPATAIRKAVKGMIPVNKLTPARLDRLKVYSGDQHGHEAQKPVEFSLKEGK